MCREGNRGIEILSESTKNQRDVRRNKRRINYSNQHSSIAQV